ncbi:MAG: DUF2726 domain-containing protein [Methylococcaceae bacterium]|nr:MAG: DUF2726 domain-containing protein [Methylococcaceae bacterium]
MELNGFIDSLLEDRILLYIVGALVAALLLLLAAMRLWLVGDKDDTKQVWPFFCKRPLTEVEQTVYHHLVKALPEHIILSQVQLAQLLGVRKGYNFQEWYSRISHLSADFVVCAKDASVIAVVELDDGNRDRGERQAADLLTHKALAAANVRLLRWQVWALPDEKEIRRQLFTPHQAPVRDEVFETPMRATH